MSIALAVVFLLGNAAFVGAQFALITARRDQMEPLAQAGNRRATIALAQMRGLDRMLAGSQLGIALCSLGLGAVAEPAFAHRLEQLFDAWSLPASVLHPAAFVLALLFVSFCHMVLGEMVPKNLALANPLPSALVLGVVMAGWTKLTGIVLTAISALANGLLRLVGVEPTSELNATYSSEDLVHLVDESAAEGLLLPDDQRRLQQALALDTLTLADIVIPLDRLVTLSPGARVGDLQRAIASSGYSRYPIRSGNRLAGFVHAKDLLRLEALGPDAPLPREDYRPMTELPAGTIMTAALEAMKRTSTHMAIVTSGSTQLGVTTLEDVLEKLLGEIPDPTED
ncbi:hemolysin family protein [Jatrophihabitans sp.]|uniref:hemolysin family protein n=1 Tax=Jatrophihabitans sp. TaxID=1932789 RepID=UPI002CBB55F2|nr:hemolysin family protein [Jatrophihabitans sp.]